MKTAAESYGMYKTESMATNFEKISRLGWTHSLGLQPGTHWSLIGRHSCSLQLRLHGRFQVHAGLRCSGRFQTFPWPLAWVFQLVFSYLDGRFLTNASQAPLGFRETQRVLWRCCLARPVSRCGLYLFCLQSCNGPIDSLQELQRSKH